MSRKPYYEEDGITIYHADCREIIGSLEQADCVLTDPPYGIHGPGDGWRAGKEQLAWDRQLFPFIEDILVMGRDLIIWGGNHYRLPPSRGWLVWRKPDAVKTMSDVELAWTNIDMTAKYYEWSISATNAERLGHPTQKPLAVMRWSLGFVLNANSVLDPFMGTGTTLRVAKDAGMKCIGIEIEERYCEMAVNRLRQRVLPLEMA